MLGETEYIDYFMGLATTHKQILHTVGGRNSFFYLPISLDLTEIDNQLKSDKAVPLLMLDALKGNFDDGQSDRFLQTVEGQFTILDMATHGDAASIRTVQQNCLAIGLQVLARMKSDSRKLQMIKPGVRFTIHNVAYDPCGPMYEKHYGYTFRFTVTCPFSYTIDSGNWSDIA